MVLVMMMMIRMITKCPGSSSVGSLGPLVVGERSLEVFTCRNTIVIREEYNYHGGKAILTGKKLNT